MFHRWLVHQSLYQLQPSGPAEDTHFASKMQPQSRGEVRAWLWELLFNIQSVKAQKNQSLHKALKFGAQQ